MLVLSRRSLEKVLFPALGVTVQVLQIKPNQVRLGIDAPPSVTVLREELDKSEAAAPLPAAQRHHAVANLLNKLNLSVHVLEKQLALGMSNDAQSTLAQLKNMLLSTDMESLGTARPPSQRRRSLVVEDDGNERELLAGLLEMNGCECRTAADGEEALEFLDTEPELPDFVIMDLWMPRCDGEFAIRKIRGNPRYRDLKVFAVSGTRPQETRISIGPDGFDAWFTKPLNPAKLWEAIRSELG